MFVLEFAAPIVETISSADRNDQFEIRRVRLYDLYHRRWSVAQFGDDALCGRQRSDLGRHAVEDLLKCIHAVVSGQPFLSPSLSGFLISRHAQARAFVQETPGLDSLTPTERRILGLIAIDRTSKEIAEELGISYRTVENHRTNISSKLNLHGSHSLLKFAYDNKSKL